jgi:2-keto-3-deoxy-L-rhamnonate aldolase RhmA
MSRLHDKLRNGGRLFGTFVQHMVNPAWAAMFSAEMFDFVVFNTEHNHVDMADFAPLAVAVKLKGIAPLVRLHARDGELAAKACDSEFEGVVLPYVEDVAELRWCILRAKHRPLAGVAAEHFLATGQYPSDKTRCYIEEKNRDVFVAAMIESVHALENLDAICSTPGLDAVFVGPNDLSVSLGIPEERDNPVFIAAVQKVIDVAARHGLPAGGHFSRMEHTMRTIRQGARFIPHSSDLRVIQAGFPEMMAAVRGGVASRPAEKVI